MKLAEYAKAATAFLLAAYTGYHAARLASSPAGEVVAVDEWGRPGRHRAGGRLRCLGGAQRAEPAPSPRRT